MVRTLVCTLIGMAVSTTASLADPLPKGSVKLDGKEAAKLYANKTAVKWEGAMGIHLADGRYLSYDKVKQEWFLEGKWWVKGNSVCRNGKVTEVKTGKTKSWKGDCNAFYKAPNGAVWSHWSNDKPGNYWDGEFKKGRYVAGDRVSPTIAKLKAKVPS